MRLYKWKDKNVMVSRRHTYISRREAIRKKFDWKRGMETSLEYKRAVRKINYKLSYWTRCMTEIDKRRNQLVAMANYVAYFTGINVKESAHIQLHRWREARNIFYKYSLENGISATLAAEYVGASRGDVAARARIAFTRTFEKNPENKQKYMNFKQYIEDIKNAENGDKQ